MKLPRPVVFLSAVAIVVLVIGAFGALLLPRLLDSQLIRERISAELAERFTGSLIIGKVTVAGFLRPRVVMERVEVSFGDTTEGSIRAVEIFPSTFHLLIGRLVIRHVLLEQPKIRIRLTEGLKQPFELEALEKQIRSVLTHVTRESPAPRIVVSDGSAEISIGERSPVILDDVGAYSFASNAQLRFKFRARSNLCEQVNIEGEIAPGTFASRLDIGVTRLKIKHFLQLASLPMSDLVREGEANLDLKIAALGLRQVNASIDGRTGPVVFARHGRTTFVDAKRFKAEMSYEPDALRVNLVQLELAMPRLQASGELKIASGSSSARITVRDVDIAEAGDLALQIVADAENVKTLMRYVPAGTIPKTTIHSTGRSFAEMTSRQNILVSGLLQDCTVFIPGADLELQKVNGSVRISGGIFEADGVTAHLGATKGWDGKFRVALGGTAAPFHLDMAVRGAAPELYSVLLKAVHDEAFRRELLKVKNLEGELTGRLTLGDKLGAISSVVTISKGQMAATYAPIPFPIVIRGGRFRYDEMAIRVENAGGSVGHSTFGGLGLTLHHDGSRRFEVDSARISVDLEQTGAWLRSFEKSRSHFEKLQSARGQIELENLFVSGTYDDPSAWRFASAGRFDQIELTHADFPGRMALSRGRFAADQRHIIFSDAAAAMSDATVTVGGTVEYEKGRPLEFETSGTATIGAQMLQWLSRHVELPEELKLRSPLSIAAGRFAWRAGADASFDGQLIAAGGPQLSLRAVQHPGGLSLRDFTIHDGSRRARISFERAENRIDVSFTGELTQQMIDKVFAAFPTQDSSLSGDIRISVSLQGPAKVSARGQLNGRNLWLPFGGEKALIDKFAIDASGEIILVRSADLRWRNSHVTVSGKAIAAEEILRVDVDVTGDQLNWEDIHHSFSGHGKPREQIRGIVAVPSVEGTIRLKAARFTFERFNLNLVEATAAISTSGVTADIDHAIACGITVTGRVGLLGGEIGVDLQLAATGAQLEPTAVCLTNRQNDVTGTYSLRATVLARGERQDLLRTLRGGFELTAHDGEFIRSPGIDATFDYLNATGDFKVAFPDLDRQTFPYRLIGVKGKMQGEFLVGDEIIVQSSLLNLSGYGNVNLAKKEIDLKGLVAVLKPVDEVIGRIPVISSMWGGSLVGIPVRVTGSLGRPDVRYLAPADIGAELLNIPMRILGIPRDAMRLFAPGDKLD
jgi:hypothetical protein